MYKHRDLDRLTFPALPKDASSKRGWFLLITTSLAAIDMSPNDLLTRWILACDRPHGDERHAMSIFHANSQGLNMLDRTIGKLMLTAETLAHPIFGLKFAAYVEWCQNQRVAPKGRALVAYVAHRFRIDRNSGKCMNVINLFNISLNSFKMQDVEDFVRRVRLALSCLEKDDVKDKNLLFQWLWDKFSNYQAIANKCEKIRESRVSSSKST